MSFRRSVIEPITGPFPVFEPIIRSVLTSKHSIILPILNNLLIDTHIYLSMFLAVDGTLLNPGEVAMAGKKYHLNLIATVFISLICLGTAANGQAIIADHNSVGQFESIPQTMIDSVYSHYNIYYVHTSHGSQIMTGIQMVDANFTGYDYPYFREVSDDLGHTGDTSWAPPTRVYLDGHPECNMAMFSWCGGCSDNTEAGINIYLAKMEDLEADYPDVIFIYMTGHLDGGGVDGNLYARNNQIRSYCAANGKYLFDFADIESYDPDGTYYPDETDACYWCSDWCAVHTCPTCGDCAHSHCFNCFLKGKAWWWMMARISGWQIGGEPVCGDANSDYTVNISDAVYIINYVFSGGTAPDPLDICDGNCDSRCNVSDAVYLINYVFSSGNQPCHPGGQVDPDC